MLLRVEIDGSVGVVEGVVILVRVCVRVFCGDRVDGMLLEIEGLVDLVEGRMICTRDCPRVFSGERVDGVLLEIDGLVCRVEGRVICVGVCARVCVWVWVSARDGTRGVKTRVRFSELFLDCWPIRVPILWERERLDDGVREILGDRLVLGVVV